MPNQIKSIGQHIIRGDRQTWTLFLSFLQFSFFECINKHSRNRAATSFFSLGLQTFIEENVTKRKREEWSCVPRTLSLFSHSIKIYRENLLHKSFVIVVRIVGFFLKRNGNMALIWFGFILDMSIHRFMSYFEYRTFGDETTTNSTIYSTHDSKYRNSNTKLSFTRPFPLSISKPFIECHFGESSIASSKSNDVYKIHFSVLILMTFIWKTEFTHPPKTRIVSVPFTLSISHGRAFVSTATANASRPNKPFNENRLLLKSSISIIFACACVCGWGGVCLVVRKRNVKLIQKASEWNRINNEIWWYEMWRARYSRWNEFIGGILCENRYSMRNVVSLPQLPH